MTIEAAVPLEILPARQIPDRHNARHNEGRLNPRIPCDVPVPRLRAAQCDDIPDQGQWKNGQCHPPSPTERSARTADGQHADERRQPYSRDGVTTDADRGEHAAVRAVPEKIHLTQAAMESD